MTPLEGVRAIECCQRLAGPMAGSHLAMLGADVVKVEAPSGDVARSWGSGAVFDVLNAGKRFVSLDLPGDERPLASLLDGAEIALVDGGPAEDVVRRAAGQSDRLRSIVVIDGSSVPGGFGTSETLAQASMGMSPYVGDPAGPPARVGADMASATAAVEAVQAALAGLLASGPRPLVSRVSLPRAIAVQKTIHFAGRSDPLAWEGYHVTAGRRPPDRGYMASDGAMSFEFPPEKAEGWRRFCERLGLQDLVEEVGDDWYSTVAMGERSDWARPRYEQALSRVTRGEAVGLAREHGGWAVPFLTADEVQHEPQTARYGTAFVVDGTSRLGPPWRIGDDRPSAGAEVARAPEVGAHNDELIARTGR